MKTYILIVLVSIINLGCKSKLNVVNSNEIIEVSIIDYGKINLTNSQILSLSKISKVNKKYFTSTIYCNNGISKMSIPINDKLFNHKYFINFNYDSTKKSKLFLKKYLVDNKEYLIAIKIE